jgi:signal transduction histidine kinase
MACQIDAHAPDKVYGDPVRLRQVLVNLLGNALKYTSTGSVSLQVMSSEPVDRRAGGVRVKFKVVDTGPGIPQELHKSIFEEFETGVDSVGGSRESTGLGLAISRKLLDRMGGCLSLESEEGLGTTFTAEIPFPHKES